MRKRRSPGIFAQLILLVSGIILIPLILLSLYFHQVMRNYMVEQLVHSQLKSLDQLDQNLARITNELNAMIKSYDHSVEIEDKLTENYSSAAEKNQAIRELEADLVKKVKDYSWVDCNLVLIGSNQTIFSSCEFTPQLSTEVIYNSYWYQKNKADTRNVNYEIFNRSYFNPKDSSPNIVAIKTLINQDTEKPYGIAILEIKESYFYDIYKHILDEGESLYLQTESGKVLSTSDRKVSLTLDPKDILLPQSVKEVENPYRYNGREYVYILKKAEVGIWDIVNLVSLETVNAEFGKYFNLLFTVEIFVFAFAILGILFIANRIYMPVHTLLARLRKPIIESGRTELWELPGAGWASAPSGGKNRQDGPTRLKRIFSLNNDSFREYEELMEEVNQTIEKLISEQEARKNAELKALAMQIRPHFLYNTLNSVKALVWTQEYEKIEPTITNLVNLLRNALSQGGRQITLAQEKENVELFTEILNIRMKQRIDLKWDTEEDWMDLRFPSFFLQPLVENSIFHGLTAEKSRITIVISVYRKEEDIVIEVIDSGAGVDKEKLKEINDLLSGAQTEKEEKDFHIGLSNVFHRLRLQYGEAVSLRMNSRPEKGTMVQIKIKRNAFGEEYADHDN